MFVDRYVCTKEKPWTTEKFVNHPDAIYVQDKDYGSDNVAVYRCPHCGLEFEETISQ